ncbi:MAG TPA: hypothetical protein VK061_09805 [Bacillota bacterium]|nr:hypothetical protein [Bacillota bacterium]
MARIQVLIEVGILVGSFLFGLLIYYFANSVPKEKKKQHIDLVISQMINFVIFIWIGKIIYQFRLFIQDPIAVLAYPSHAESFYIATVLFLINIGVQVYWKKFALKTFINVFIPVMIASAFLYEFIQMQLFEQQFISHFIVLIALLLCYVFMKKSTTNNLLLLFGWTLGLLIISYIDPFIMVFQYLISRIYIILTMVLALISYIYFYRRRGM